MDGEIHEATDTNLEAPPPYQDVVAGSTSWQHVVTTTLPRTGKHQPETATRKQGIKVASLPRHAPPGGLEYISVYKPNMSEQGAMHHVRTVLLWPWRFIESRVNTYKAQRAVKNDGFHPSNPDEEHGGEGPIPPEGIRPAEIERTVNNAYDWTRDWGWQMSLKNGDSSNRWVAWVCIYLNDLPGLLSAPDTIPWTDSSRTEKLSGDVFPRRHVSQVPCHKFECSWMFRERGPSPRWSAAIAVRHSDSGAIAGIDPWAFLTSALTIETDINQRTGPGKFKKVMWYRKRFGYGNDLVGQPVEPWKRGQKAQYVAFANRILPGGS